MISTLNEMTISGIEYGRLVAITSNVYTPGIGFFETFREKFSMKIGKFWSKIPEIAY